MGGAYLIQRETQTDIVQFHWLILNPSTPHFETWRRRQKGGKGNERAIAAASVMRMATTVDLWVVRCCPESDLSFDALYVHTIDRGA
jgi:hypothetical protein